MCVCVCVYIYIYIYNAEINDKEYYFFRNSEFHAACATIFMQSSAEDCCASSMKL